MTLDHHVDSPDYAKTPVHWWRAKESGNYLIEFPGGHIALSATTHTEADVVRVCHAFHVTKLAEDYAKAEAVLERHYSIASVNACNEASRAVRDAVRP